MVERLTDGTSGSSIDGTDHVIGNGRIGSNADAATVATRQQSIDATMPVVYFMDSYAPHISVVYPSDDARELALERIGSPTIVCGLEIEDID